MSVNISDGEFAHVTSAIEHNIRLDGRTRTQLRNISVKTGVISTAYGSSHVVLGPEQGMGHRTEVIVAVYGHIMDNTQGSYWFHVDSTPLGAAPADSLDLTKEAFANLLEVQLSSIYGASRTVNKGVHPEAAVIFTDTRSRDSPTELSPIDHVPSLPEGFSGASSTAIDRSTLRINESLSWALKIEVFLIGAGGNTLLATTNAVNAALADTKLPSVENGADGSADLRLSAERASPIPSLPRLPLASVVISTGHFYLVDPLSIEERIPHSKAYLVAVNHRGSVVHFTSIPFARNSSSHPAGNVLCILRETPMLLKDMHDKMYQ